jgi:DnaJ-class molecular chaperone
MSFRMFMDSEVRDSIRERGVREETNKKISNAWPKCKNCKGTGLKYYTLGEYSENIGWSGEFCETCSGTGYVDWLEAIVRGTGELV